MQLEKSAFLLYPNGPVLTIIMNTPSIFFFCYDITKRLSPFDLKST